MDQTNNQTTSQSLNQSPNPIIVSDADVTVENAFADIIGVVQLSESPDSVYHYFVASPMYAGFGDLSSPERIFFIEDTNKMSLGLRNYLTSADTVELIFSTGKEFNFEDGQISKLSILVRELLTGKMFIKDFPTAISSKLGIDDIKAGEIANKIISKSFGPIIEDVKRIQRSKFPDKISQMQKESQPTVMTQSTARPDTPRPEINSTPLQNGGARPLSEVRPQGLQQGPSQQIRPITPAQAVQPPRPVISPQIPSRPQQPQPVRPVMPPPVEVRLQQPAPIQAPVQTPPQPSRPLNLPPTPQMQPRQNLEVRPRSEDRSPQTQAPSRPQFKVPNIDSDLSGIRIPASTPAGKAEESLEKELEKVANVIDLRNKPE